MYCVWVLYTPFRLLIGFITISHLTIIYYTVAHLHSLQSYMPIFHSWRLHIFTLQINIQFTRCIFFTYKLSVTVSYRELLVELLLKNWTKTAKRFTYIGRNSTRKTEPVDTVVSGHVMSCCLATGSQKYSCVTSAFTTALPWKQAWCSMTWLGTAFNLPWLKTARRKHHFPYCCVACLQTSVSLRLLHGVKTSQYILSLHNIMNPQSHSLDSTTTAI
jgi:hypothetical protein